MVRLPVTTIQNPKSAVRNPANLPPFSLSPFPLFPLPHLNISCLSLIGLGSTAVGEFTVMRTVAGWNKKLLSAL